MRIENLEKIKGWTPPGNFSVNPIVIDVERSIIDYTFFIRYQGKTYEAVVLRDSEMSEFGKRHRIAFKAPGVTDWFETWLHNSFLNTMRDFYDVLHTMLYRISSGTFEKHYPK